MKPPIDRISVQQARALQDAGALLVDIRDASELELGTPAGARHLTVEALAQEGVGTALANSRRLLLICGSGRRSQLAAEKLAALGASRVATVEGGFAAWQSAGLPVSGEVISDDFRERYSRQLRLPQVGLAGQLKLQQARVLVVGAGGLGAPVGFYLAGAGVGYLRLVDDDVVDRSNLQRQIVHTDQRVGRPKVESARQALLALNPSIQVDAVHARLDADNVESTLRDVDLVIDGADNFPTRYLLSDACVNLGKPLVYGAVHRFEGQVSVFDAGRRRGESPCYRCLFPEAPDATDAPNCAEAGVLGVVPGIVGLLQATEAIKLLIGLGDSLDGRLLHFDALSMTFRQTRLRPDPACLVCAPGRGTAPYAGSSRTCSGS